MTLLVTMAAIILEGETKTGIMVDEHIADASVSAKEVLKKLQASTEEVLVLSLFLSACPILVSNDPLWMPVVSPNRPSSYDSSSNRKDSGFLT
jgi:hypothetical protein